jgi:MFS superfamily sulfate permease-like transporter
MEAKPKKGLHGLVENWQADLVAALSVALIALPLSLGIALAAGAPAMAGVFSAIVGGVVTTLYRGGHVSVNGPAKGVIGVILLGIGLMDDGSGQAFNYVLAAVVVSGLIQVLLGALKLGRLAEIFHSTVIHGILAAIGIIIFAKQIHVALGTSSDSPSIIQNLVDAFVMLPNANPFVLIISIIGLFLLLFHSKTSYKFIKILPGPIWVIGLSIPFVYFFNFFESQSLFFFGVAHDVGPNLLLDIPDSIIESIMHPNFDKINTIEFWTTVFSILIITSIESLAIAKAVDKIDPYKRKTNLNKDLVGIGLSTVAAGLIGGLPVIAVIIRSTINIHNGAKTKWSNMYQGLILLILIVILGGIMKQVPLCAFAVLLVYTGFKLASPAVFKQAYNQGPEQLVFFIGTMVLTLYTNLLIGLMGGLVMVLITQVLVSNLSLYQFFKLVYFSDNKLQKISDNAFNLKIRGVANFLGILKVDNLISKVPPGANINIDLSETKLVGITYMDYLVEFLKSQRDGGGKAFIIGLDSHVSYSTYNRALKICLTNSEAKLSQRQIRLQNLAVENGYQYSSRVVWDTSYLKTFKYFEIRPIERKYNCLKSQIKGLVKWEISDVTFNEGQAFSAETFNTTLMVIKLNKKIPAFKMEKEGVLDVIFDKVIPFKGYKDIDFEAYPDFSKKYLLSGSNEGEIRNFFTKDIISFFEKKKLYHIESNGEALLIHDKTKLARTDETISFIDFGKSLIEILGVK